eukprot:SAG31_NODE_2731_length_5175_cov_1.794129_4_plen_447_part_00
MGLFLLNLRHPVDPSLAFAVQQMAADAESAMGPNDWVEGSGPWSVMNKSTVGPSGDMHDYFSTAKYCWPCNTICNAAVENATGNDCGGWERGSDFHPKACDNATGLPWLCHDGYANPINDHLDRGLWDSLFYTVPPLALSATLTGNTTHAARAAMLVRTWFLDERSRMNPNLEHAQAIPGANNGTCGGIIDMSDHHKLLDVIDAMTMLAASPLQSVSGFWTADDAADLMAWVSTFREWIKYSKLSMAEAAAHNNHGTWHDVLSVGLALYTSDVDSAKLVCDRFLNKRIAEQVAPAGAERKYGGPMAGALPMEDGRTNSQSYHSMDADGLLILAQLCNDTNLLHATVPCATKTKGPEHWARHLCDSSSRVSLVDVPEWAARFAAGREGWPSGFKQISGDEAPYYWPQVFRRAANLYKNASYENVVLNLPHGGVAPKYVLDLIEPYII